MAITSGALGTAQGGLNYAYADKTMDQTIADKIGTTTRFKSLHLGVASTDTSDADFGAVAKSISHNGPNSPNLPEYDPSRSTIASSAPGFSTGHAPTSRRSPSPRARACSIWSPPTRRRSKLRLGRDRQGAARSAPAGHRSTSRSSSCGMPVRPRACTDADAARRLVPRHRRRADSVGAAHAAQTELLVFALACDQTRVFTYRFSPCNDFTVYPGFPTFTIDPTTTNTGTSMHGMTHSEGGDQPSVQKCVDLLDDEVRRAARAPARHARGRRSLLDNCAILGFTECTEGRSHNAAEPARASR